MSNELRDMTSITSDMLSDEQIDKIIDFASFQFNQDLMVEEKKEKVEYFSDIKLNTIDGSNTTFYVKNSYIGDLNDDFSISEYDIEFWKEKDNTKTSYTISSVDIDNDSYELDVAPTNDGGEYFVRYKHSLVKLDPIAAIAKVAVLELAAAWAFSKLNVGKATRFHLGNMTVFRDTEAHNYFMNRYDNTMAKINSGELFGTVKTEIQ
jgi:hypothetical protein